ncbi:unnamed protein product [Heligmosomoides polygyrus]|uniref:Uncharacterized protein n=1 Tax=Heligmosomoides polygyrus TaxID=6339 RepID=A0A183GJW8_HELPZ|nr:unnamed protein product [Heligmosomoides polygyrus]
MAVGGLVDRVVVGDLELGEVGLDVEVPGFKVAAVVIRIVVGGNVVVPLVESLVDVVVLCVDDVVVEEILALGVLEAGIFGFCEEAACASVEVPAAVVADVVVSC